MTQATQFEIHMFMAVARVAKADRFPVGEHHPMLVLIRQHTGSDHDFDAAEIAVLRGGWTEIDFTKAGTLPAEASQQTDEPFASCYADAMRNGSALMVYDTIVEPKPAEKKAQSPEHPH